MSPGPRRRADSASQAPAFLQLSEIEIDRKFNELDAQQRERIMRWPPTEEAPSQWARLTGNDVLERNRYLNIDPWANNRIHLKVAEGQCDYINASPISVKGSRNGRLRRYIATQGPKESSSSHFWQMIWQETKSVGVIVMLTQTHELGREKCFAYFPKDASNSIFNVGEFPEPDDTDSSQSGSESESESEDDFKSAKGSIDNTTDDATGFHARVELLEMKYDEKTGSTVRKMLLKVGEEERVIWHYLFEGWPDFSIPSGENRLALLALVKESVQKAAGKDNPRIVHCSAGVGRSGTFIALDYLLSELKEGALDDVPPGQDRISETVDELRKQRMMMVQGESQFHFLYEIMKEQWLERHGLEMAADAKKEQIQDEEMTVDGPRDGGSNL